MLNPDTPTRDPKDTRLNVLPFLFLLSVVLLRSTLINADSVYGVFYFKLSEKAKQRYIHEDR